MACRGPAYAPDQVQSLVTRSVIGEFLTWRIRKAWCSSSQNYFQQTFIEQAAQ